MIPQLLFLLFICFLPYSWAQEILIMTHVYNKPEMIYWQQASFEKFIQDDYQFIVFNDAPSPELQSLTHKICNELNLTCIDIPQSIHDCQAPYLPGSRNPLGDPSAECAETIQYMLDLYGFDFNGIVLLIDSDMFAMRKVHIRKMMENYEIGAHPQCRVGKNKKIDYFLPNLIFFDMEKIADKSTLNFNVGEIDETRVDTGGFTHFYLETHPELKWLKTNCITSPYLESSYLNQPEIVNYFRSHPKMYQLATELKYPYEFYANYTFMHFRAGSEWLKMEAEKQSEKNLLFFEALNEVISF